MTYIPSVTNEVDNSNSSSTPLLSNATFTGAIVDVSNYSSIFINLFSDQSSAVNGFKISFSPDGTNFTTETHDEFTYTANTFFTHTSQVNAKYYRLTYENGPVTQEDFRLQSLLLLTPPTNYVNTDSDINNKSSSTLTTSKITGLLPNEVQYKGVKTSSEGALHVYIDTPTTAFGEVSTASNETSVQGDFVYGINSDIYRSINSGTGSSVTTSPNLAVVNSGTVARSLGYLQSLRNSRYRSGQGLLVRFTAIYSNGVTGNDQLVGAGNFKSGLYFGYKGTTFGVNRLSGGSLAIQTLTITTAATNGTATITLFDGATPRVFMVPVVTPVAVAPQTGAQITAGQISSFNFTTQYPGWIVSSNGAVLTFISMVAQPNDNITVSFSAAGAATPAELVAGVAPSGTGPGGEDEFIPQSLWNVDVMDGSNSVFNPSGALLDPTVGNVYQIVLQYLGFGGISFFIENPNTATFQLVHQIKYSNNFIITNLKVPNLSYQMFSRNTTNTTSVGLRASSNYISIQGMYKELGVVRTIVVSSYSLPGSATEFELFAIRPSVIFNNMYSVVNILPVSLTLANDDMDSFRVNLYLSPTSYQASTTSWSNSLLTPATNTSALIAQQPNSATLPTAATGGMLLTSINVPTGTSTVVDLLPYNLLINYFQTLSVGIQSIGIVSANVWSVAISWIEQQ